jgi:hypothetical protein
VVGLFPPIRVYDHTLPALSGGENLGIKGFLGQEPPRDSRILVRQRDGGHLLAATR